ncbi:MAG: chromosome partitioning [Desulfobulbaceae bacterium]|nr:MAG: chromosome partitioning [Desulfobulbaceae bacterium]
MNLRKALDKAQKERQFDVLAGDGGNVVVDNSLPLQKEVGKDWQSPVYSESAQVQLHQDILMANRCVCIDPMAPVIDSYKVLRAQILQKTREKGWNTLMITSAQPGEGKTLTAINLAITFSKECDQTVMLVDCDLKKQDVHKRFGYESGRGLGDYLVNDADMKEIISWPGIDKMTIISGGQTIQDGTEMLGSPRMKALVQDMKVRYADRYVIYDVPCLLDRADAITFASFVDGIVIVTEAGRTSAKDVEKAMSLVPREKVLGFVLNRFP